MRVDGVWPIDSLSRTIPVVSSCGLRRLDEVQTHGHARERSVLHVLPHPGGGGETYVDVLEAIPGYSFSRIYLGRTARPNPARLGRGLLDGLRRSNEHDLLHVHGEVAAGLFTPLLMVRPSVVTLHGLHLLRRLRGARRHAAALNLKAILRAADRTICVSKAEYEELVNAVGIDPARRAIVVRNGARVVGPASPVDRTQVRAELGLTTSEPVGIWVGSLDGRRDPVTVVRAAERASVSLLVAGDGPLRPQVELSAKESVRVLGHRTDVSRLLTAADFFVLASHREGMSFALVEALANGLPAVVTDVAENIEAVNGAGIIVPRDDEDALVAAFRRLSENAAGRAAFAKEAIRRAAELFDLDAMIGRTHAVYDDVLGELRTTSPSL